jgi:hypothetical protein
VDARLQCRRTSAAPSLGQHRNQGSEGIRHPLRQGSGRAVNREHDEGNNDLSRTVHSIKAMGKRVGVAINPATSAAVLEAVSPWGRRTHQAI